MDYMLNNLISSWTREAEVVIDGQFGLNERKILKPYGKNTSVDKIDVASNEAARNSIIYTTLHSPVFYP